MPLVVPIAHDFTCNWCWIGFHQAERLKEEMGVEIEWRAFEMYPAELGFPPTPPKKIDAEDRPPTPSRFELAMKLEGMEPLAIEPPGLLSTRNAHLAVEFAKRLGLQDELVGRLYAAYWKHGLAIDDLQIIGLLATGLLPDVPALLDAVREGTGAERIVEFDQAAHSEGVFNLPTLWIGDTRYAEQPYDVLAAAIRREKYEAEPVPTFYRSLSFPEPPHDRPTILINMVATIDGKTVSGLREGHVMDLGSRVDHLVMRSIESACDAVMIGAGTLRATPGLWYDRRLIRLVVSATGELDYSNRFFTDAPEKALVVTGQKGAKRVPEGILTIALGNGRADLREVVSEIRGKLGVKTLLVEGGSELNAQLLREDLVDELFLTVAPKVKLGRLVPTYAGGEPLPGRIMWDFELVEFHQVENEVFLRYRRKRAE